MESERGRRDGQGTGAPRGRVVVEVAIEWVLGAMLIGGPMALGGVLPEARFALLAGAALLLILSGWRWLLGSQPPHRGPALLVLLLFVLVGYGALLGFPLPQGLAAMLAPANAAMREALSGASPDPATTATLSLAPWQTLPSILLGLAFIGVFVAASGLRSHLRPGAGRRVAWCVVAAASLAAVTGIAQRVAGLDDRVLFLIPVDPEAQPFGPFVNRNHFAGLMALALPLGAGLLLHAWRRAMNRLDDPDWTRVLTELSTSRLGPAMFLALLLTVMLGALLISGSRGGLLAAFCGLTPVVILAAARRGRVGRGALLAVCATLIAGSALLFFWVDPEILPARFRDPMTAELRIPLWQDALALGRSTPIFGIGPGAFQSVFPSQQTFPAAFAFPFAESDLVCFGVERGAIGLLLLGAISLLVLVELARGLRRLDTAHRFLLVGAFGGVAAIAVHSIFDFNCHIPSNLLAFAAVLGLLAHWTAANASGPRPQLSRCSVSVTVSRGGGPAAR